VCDSSPDLVAAGVGVSILPETAVAQDHEGVRHRAHRAYAFRAGSPSSPREVCKLSLADKAVHDAVRQLVRDERLPHNQRPS